MSKCIYVSLVKRQIVKHWYKLESLVDQGEILRFMIEFGVNFRTGRPKGMSVRAYSYSDSQGNVREDRYHILIKVPDFLLHPFLANKSFSREDMKKDNFYQCMTVDRSDLDM